MAKSSRVEKYEQLLREDPTSPAFVELAKALIGEAEYSRALDVCEKGLGHHPKSVVGRVLWGKALIHLGRPAEAMAQFDHAVAVDRENAQVYNLIGEVLLHKGLYRSALPLLRRAVALQPNEPRVRQWLEQTQAALAGGPAPILGEPTQVELRPLSSRGLSGASADEAPATDAGQGSDRAQRSVVALGEAPTAVPGDRTEIHVAYSPRETPARSPAVTVPLALQRPLDTAGDTAGPERSGFALGGGEPDVLPGMTSTFQALSEGASAPSGAHPAAAHPHGGDAGAVSLAVAGNRPTEPTLLPSPELLKEATRASPPSSLLGEVPAPSSGSLAAVVLPPTGPKPAVPVAPPRPPGSTRALLEDIPELPEPRSSVEVPKVDVSVEATRAIAQEYERELRAKLAAAASQKSVWQRHGVKLAVLAVGVVGVAVGVGAFVHVRTQNRGQSLQGALVVARTEIARDAPESRRKADEALALAREMAEDNEEVWALTAYLAALRFSDAPTQAELRTQAEAALARPRVRERFPALVLAAEYHLATDARSKRERGARLQKASAEGATHFPLGVAALNELGGRLLLEEGGADVEAALKRLDASFQALPNTRALLALAAYYRSHDDVSTALGIYDKAVELAPLHPEAVLGRAEARLALGQDVTDALAQIDALPAPDALPEPSAARRELIRGRVLAAVGQEDEALRVLEEGGTRWKAHAFAFRLAQGAAARLAGRPDVGQKALEAALKERPRDEAALEELGRVLLAQDRERELLRRIDPQTGARAVSLVRGIAYARLGEWKRARAELAQTQVKGKYPLETVLYLALADAAEGEGDKALEVLEKTLASAKRSRSDIRIALGQVYWQRGALDKAQEQFEEAAKDAKDVEGKCALGRLWLARGAPDKAQESLAQALLRQGAHAEAQTARVTALLQLGRVEEALAQAKAHLERSPLQADALRDLAEALLHAQDFKAAEETVAKAAKADPKDARTARVEARVLFARGNSRAAFKALERSNQLDPKSAETFCEIGLAFLRQGESENAAKAYQAALRESPQALCGKVGRYYAQLPATAQGAAQELSTWAEQAPASADRAFAQATLARVLLGAGQVAQAQKAAESAVTLAPWTGPAHLAAGLVALRRKDETAAAAAFERAVGVDPTYGAIRLSYADLLARKDETQQKALEHYQIFLRIGGSEQEQSRVERTVKSLKKKWAQR